MKQKLKLTIEVIIDIENYSIIEVLEELRQYCEAEIINMEVKEEIDRLNKDLR